jgi:hypothetical protein
VCTWAGAHPPALDLVVGFLVLCYVVGLVYLIEPRWMCDRPLCEWKAGEYSQFQPKTKGESSDRSFDLHRRASLHQLFRMLSGPAS